jgi:hypothetical protein
MILGGSFEGGEAVFGELSGMALGDGKLFGIGAQKINGAAKLLGNEGGLGVDGVVGVQG